MKVENLTACRGLRVQPCKFAANTLRLEFVLLEIAAYASIVLMALVPEVVKLMSVPGIEISHCLYTSQCARLLVQARQ
jgi:hypothetical protein